MTMAQDFEDDIYYDGRKAEKTQKSQPAQVQGAGYTYGYNEWSDPTMGSDRDVDEYNRFGGYYESAIDTIGAGVASSEDFVYTQQIQKFYNPTIVVDNQDVLADVLNNSYGNVNIIYGVTGPAFSSWYYTPYYATYTPWGGFYSPYNWGWYTGWLDPWYALTPGWYPTWGWGWGWTSPGWGWGWNAPGWCYPYYPSYYPSYYADYHRRPTTGVRPGWSAGSRPSGSSHATSNARPGSNHRGTTASNPRQTGNGRVSGSTRNGYRPGTTARPAGSETVRSTRNPAQTQYRYDSHIYRGNAYLNGASSASPALRGGVTATTPSVPSSGSTVRPQNNRGSYTQPSTSRGSSNARQSSRSGSSYRQSSGSSGSSYRSSGSYRSGGGSRSAGGGRASGGRR